MLLPEPVHAAGSRAPKGRPGISGRNEYAISTLWRKKAEGSGSAPCAVKLADPNVEQLEVPAAAIPTLVEHTLTVAPCGFARAPVMS